MSEKILITGSEGLIGKVIEPELKKKYELYFLDIKEKKDSNYFKADIGKVEQLEGVFNKLPQIDIIIHLAADPRPNASWRDVLNKNIIGTKNIYEMARKFEVDKVIYASSNHVTGAYEGLSKALYKKDNPKVVTVSDPIKPDSYYGTSKAFGEIIARQFNELYKIKSICLRIGAVVPDDKPKDLRSKKIWLSYRDLKQIIERSIDSNIEYGIYYAISNNSNTYLDISNARQELKYKPQDNGMNT